MVSDTIEPQLAEPTIGLDEWEVCLVELPLKL